MANKVFVFSREYGEKWIAVAQTEEEAREKIAKFRQAQAEDSRARHGEPYCDPEPGDSWDVDDYSVDSALYIAGE
jgi:hypothetical protein